MQDFPQQTQPSDRVTLDVATARGGVDASILPLCLFTTCFSDED
jgi:hypothetical protein